jgi:hypothetical protein
MKREDFIFGLEISLKEVFPKPLNTGFHWLLQYVNRFRILRLRLSGSGKLWFIWTRFIYALGYRVLHPPGPDPVFSKAPNADMIRRSVKRL